jgi:hypothetical protein
MFWRREYADRVANWERLGLPDCEGLVRGLYRRAGVTSAVGAVDPADCVPPAEPMEAAAGIGRALREGALAVGVAFCSGLLRTRVRREDTRGR